MHEPEAGFKDQWSWKNDFFLHQWLVVYGMFGCTVFLVFFSQVNVQHHRIPKCMKKKQTELPWLKSAVMKVHLKMTCHLMTNLLRLFGQAPWTLMRRMSTTWQAALVHRNKHPGRCSIDGLWWRQDGWSTWFAGNVPVMSPNPASGVHTLSAPGWDGKMRRTWLARNFWPRSRSPCDTDRCGSELWTHSIPSFAYYARRITAPMASWHTTAIQILNSARTFRNNRGSSDQKAFFVVGFGKLRAKDCFFLLLLFFFSWRLRAKGSFGSTDSECFTTPFLLFYPLFAFMGECSNPLRSESIPLQYVWHAMHNLEWNN